MKKLLGCLVVVAVAGGSAIAASDDRWIHVRVDAQDGNKGRVDIQVPIGMVQSLLPMLKLAHAHGSIHVDDKEGRSQVRMKVPLPLIDAVLAGGDTLDSGALGTALAKAPAGELLAVDDEDAHVRIWIDGAAAPAREEAP